MICNPTDWKDLFYYLVSICLRDDVFAVWDNLDTDRTTGDNILSGGAIGLQLVHTHLELFHVQELCDLHRKLFVVVEIIRCFG